jgi:hemin uptake protein HemP
MPRPSTPDTPPDAAAPLQDVQPHAVARIRSEDLFRQGREIEIEHYGKIYRLRVTQLNKLILTA